MKIDTLLQILISGVARLSILGVLPLLISRYGVESVAVWELIIVSIQLAVVLCSLDIVNWVYLSEGTRYYHICIFEISIAILAVVVFLLSLVYETAGFISAILMFFSYRLSVELARSRRLYLRNIKLASSLDLIFPCFFAFFIWFLPNGLELNILYASAVSYVSLKILDSKVYRELQVGNLRQYLSDFYEHFQNTKSLVVNNLALNLSIFGDRYLVGLGLGLEVLGVYAVLARVVSVYRALLAPFYELEKNSHFKKVGYTINFLSYFKYAIFIVPLSYLAYSGYLYFVIPNLKISNINQLYVLFLISVTFCFNWFASMEGISFIGNRMQKFLVLGSMMPVSFMLLYGVFVGSESIYGFLYSGLLGAFFNYYTRQFLKRFI